MDAYYATYEAYDKALYIRHNRDQIGRHYLKSGTYQEINTVLATYDLRVDQGWKYFPGGGVHRARLRTIDTEGETR